MINLKVTLKYAENISKNEYLYFFHKKLFFIKYRTSKYS